MSNTTSAVVKKVSEPVVTPPYYVRRLFSQLFSPVIFQVFSSFVPTVPLWLKAVLVSLLLINIRSFPLAWHIRVLGAAVVSRNKARPSIHPLLPWIKSNKHPTTSPGITPRFRLDQMPLGKDIFTDKHCVVQRATPDECDWNGHMSNSSYPRALDEPRMTFLASRFLRVHFDGGNFALGGTNFIYHREIPFMAKYEIELSIAGWDEKWLYVLTRFMSPSKPVSKTASIRKSKSAQNLKRLIGEVVTPQHEAEAKAKKAAEANNATENEKKAAEEEREKAIKANEKRTLYCTSISRCCFKAGRKTIPAWFVVATSGYGSYASTRTNWDKAENLRKETLTKKKEEYMKKRGKPLPRDSFVLGSGYRKGGILTAFDLSRKPNDESDESGLGSWQDPKQWHLAEWEERRLRGLDLVRTLGGIAEKDLVGASNSLAFLE